ncbi:CAP20-like protein [Zymoseptoria brevis]|uniref:CAP20-like protein n=1 Tax=Zymoseptoria brevis TaxID=1047168 RepID=A0A0F4GHL0_9PEZI|nr:CAP20-like protein [Zymoseptoria brevis]
MPHATETLTNGDKSSSSSQFISHLTSLPAVNDGIETFKSNPYGKKSLEIVDGAYTRIGKPVEPYLQTPYSYAKPYVQKADELADSGLSWGEKQFPIVKEDTHTIVDTAKGYIFFPYSYLSKTWQDEYSKTAQHRGAGLSTTAFAIISTELRIASDVAQKIADILGPRVEQGKQKTADYAKAVGDKADTYSQKGQEKLNEVAKEGEKKANEVKGQAEEKGSQAKKQAEGVKEDVKAKAQK